MPKKYTAPVHVSGVTLANGRALRCNDDGTLDAPDDLTDADLADLTRNGFSPAADTPVDAPATADAVKSPAAKKTATDTTAAA